MRLLSGKCDEFTLARIELQTNSGDSSRELCQGRSHGTVLPCQAAVVQVGINELQPTLTASCLELLQDGLESQGKQKGAKRVSLLNTAL